MTYTISQLNAALIRKERRVTVQYKGKPYVVADTDAFLSDYAVTAAVGHMKWWHSQPCQSVAKCKEWIRLCAVADIEEAQL